MRGLKINYLARGRHTDTRTSQLLDSKPRTFEAIARVHLFELDDITKKNNELLKGYVKEVKKLKTLSEKLLNITLATKESFDATLTCKDKQIVKVPVEVK